MNDSYNTVKVNLIVRNGAIDLVRINKFVGVELNSVRISVNTSQFLYSAHI